MKSNLVAWAIISCSISAVAGETTFESMVRFYNDSETRVMSPHARITSSVANDSVVVGAGFAEDVVTSSSSDVRSWSSKGVISDTRREETGNLTFNLQNGSATAYFIQSDENDYHSQTYGFATTRDFFQKNTTLDLGVGLGVDHVGNSHESGFDASMQHQNVTAGITQVFSPIAIGQLLYDFTAENGFLNGSYRLARLDQGDGTVVGIPENSPNSRIRQSLALKYNYFFKSLNSSLASTFRVYYDSWDVRSGTLEERLSHDYGRHFTNTIVFRYYQQSQANFYQDKYNSAALPIFFTGNKTLASYFTALLGVRPTFHIGKNWEAYGKMEYYLERFKNFTDVGDPTDPTDDKIYVLNALIFGAGFSGKF